MTNAQKFDATYIEELANVVRNHPTEYAWPIEDVPVVAAKMLAKVATNGGYSKDGLAFKATCKRLGIKYTYTAINAYYNAAG